MLRSFGDKSGNDPSKFFPTIFLHMMSCLQESNQLCWLRSYGPTFYYGRTAGKDTWSNSKCIVKYKSMTGRNNQSSSTFILVLEVEIRWIFLTASQILRRGKFLIYFDFCRWDLTNIQLHQRLNWNFS